MAMFLDQSTWLEGIWEGHPRNICRTKIENWPTSLGDEDFFRFVAMETRILHGSKYLKEFCWGHWEDAFCEVSSQLTHWLLKRRCWRTTHDFVTKFSKLLLQICCIWEIFNGGLLYYQNHALHIKELNVLFNIIKVLSILHLWWAISPVAIMFSTF